MVCVCIHEEGGEKKSVTSQKIKILILWDWLAYSERITTRDELNDPSGRNLYRSRSARTKCIRPPDFFQIYSQIDLKLHNSTAAVEDFIHETSWFRGKS